MYTPSVSECRVAEGVLSAECVRVVVRFANVFGLVLTSTQPDRRLQRLQASKGLGVL